MHKRNGLALLLTLLASSLCLCLIFLLAGLTRSESAAANHFSAQARLRAAARGAALRALGGLQAAAGPDVACSYRDDTHGTRVAGRSFAWDLDGAAELEGISWRWSVEDLSLSADLAARQSAVQAALGAAPGDDDAIPDFTPPTEPLDAVVAVQNMPDDALHVAYAEAVAKGDDAAQTLYTNEVHRRGE
jgi:hypothetical protein